jgi:enoyl-CoA hydratase/carnithine racemase
MTEPVLYVERDDIAIISINRPHKKNTLTDAVIQGIADGIDRAQLFFAVKATLLLPDTT